MSDKELKKTKLAKHARNTLGVGMRTIGLVEDKSHVIPLMPEDQYLDYVMAPETDPLFNYTDEEEAEELWKKYVK